MGRMMGLRTSLLCVAAINALLGAEAKLVLLVTLTRHGSRVSCSRHLTSTRMYTPVVPNVHTTVPIVDIQDTMLITLSSVG